MIVSWIFNTIEPGLRSTISYKETTKELWDDIQQQFSVRNGARVHQLKTEVANCKQHGDSIMAYYGRLKKLWDNLNDYDPLPTYSCNGCKCNFVTRLQQHQEYKRVHQFIMGLDELSYSNVRSNIITSNPLPNHHRVYSQVIEQEQLQVMTRVAPIRSDLVSFAMKTVSPGPWNSGGDRKDNGVVCSHCQKLGHSIDICFHLHGYPNWWLGNSTQGRGRGRGNQGRGHGGVALANVAQGVVGAAANVPHGRPLDDFDKAGLENLSKDDWETLKSLWNTHTNNTFVAQPRLNGKDRTSRMLIGVGEELKGLYVARGELLVSAHGAVVIKNMGL